MTLPERIGPYKILREIGRGGMAVVYLARHVATHEQVALKVLPRQFTFDPDFLERFRREAQTARGLNHPAIVAVLDHGDDDDQPYIAMRYMSGGTLAERMQRARMTDARISEVVRQLASALDHIHTAGLIHRDLKPNNILFDEFDNAYLADFGVAKMTLASAALTTATYVGTPAYMSPEQATARGDIDARSDVYGLGVIVYEILSGKPPYTADTPFGLSLAHLNDPIPTLSASRPDLGRAGDGVIRKVLAKSPHGRYASAGRFARAIEQLLAGEKVEELAAVPVESGPTLLVPRKSVAHVGRAWLFGSAGAAIMAMTMGLAALAGTAAFGMPWQSGSLGGTPVNAAVPAVLDLDTLGGARAETLASSTPTTTPSPTWTVTTTATELSPTPTPSRTATATRRPILKSATPETVQVLPTALPPTATAPNPTDTAAPPAPTSVPPVETKIPPTATPEVKPTRTSGPPTAEPTSTAVPPTETPVPPTQTPLPTPTDFVDPPIDDCPPKYGYQCP